MKTGRVVTIAIRGLRRNPLRTSLMMIGIVIAIAALTVIVSLGEGSKRQVMERMKRMGADASLMVRPGAGVQRGVSPYSITTVTLEDAEAIEAEIQNAKHVAPIMVRGEVVVKYGARQSSPTVFGVTPIWRVVRTFDVDRGAFIDDDDLLAAARVCLLGGQVVRELFGDADPLGQSVMINNVACQVKGVLEEKGTSAGGGNLDNRILVPLTTFSRRLFNQKHLGQIVIQLDDISAMYRTAEDVKALLRERHQLAATEPDDFTIRIPEEALKTATAVSSTWTTLLALVAGVSLIAGGVVVANIMLIAVTERRREIGLRKAVGARRRDILLQFLIETTVVAIAGGLVGIVLGYAGAEIAARFTGITPAVSWVAVVLGCGVSAIVGLIAGVQPARKAAFLDPIEALR